MARHPPVPGEWPAELHLRDPQGDVRQDGGCHGEPSAPRLLGAFRLHVPCARVDLEGFTTPVILTCQLVEVLAMPECLLSFICDISRHLGQR